MIKNMSAAPDEVLQLKHRAIVAPFAETMAQQLTSHKHIGNWDGYRPGKIVLMTELQVCLDKLKQAIDSEEGVRAKAADVSNFCMKAAELFGK
jgi:hypothetical protein